MVSSHLSLTATLHFQEALWALFLPMSVPGRVSDIWRSYIGQAIMSDYSIHIGFMPRPIVVQGRDF